MKPTLTARKSHADFVSNGQASTIRVYVEARRRHNGELYWRNVWTSGQAERYGHGFQWTEIRKLLKFEGLFAAIDLDAVDITGLDVRQLAQLTTPDP